ncbi:MAG: hypothetical protein DMF91_09385 [Acidobacteria bacterium]|nr:MAG: hypothetical protein DMF91_09385 [Acidobacteriota bacterium]
MVHRRQATAIAVAVTVVFSAGLIAQKKDDKKQDEAQKKELQSVLKLVDDVAAGTAQPPNDLSLTWVREDFIKAQGNKEYVPFVMTIDSSKISSGNLVFYWRVAPKGAAPAAPAPVPAAKDDKKDKDKDKAKPRVEYPYEDYNVVPVTQAAAPGGPMKIARSFTVPAGTYDVFVVAKEAVPMTPPPKGAPSFVAKTSVMKQSLTVPDFWNGELSTSTVLVAERIDPLPAPLTPQQQEERPYALGQMEIVPQLALTYSKKGELSVFMLIYNPKSDAANKPDIVVEYNFYQKQAGSEKFFNKTNPTNLNAQTLPPGFDMAAGHQLQAGQAVPLASFPEGDYRLEIKVTDKVANKTLTRDVNFTVTAS